MAALFFVNGAVFANAVPRYPELKAGLGLSNAVFGSVVAAFPSGALFVAGSLDAIADVAANAQGLRKERRYGRSILNSLHGVWSIGAVVGGLMGAAAAGPAVPVPWHLTSAAVLCGCAVAATPRFLLDGPQAAARPAATGVGGVRLIAAAPVIGAVADA